MKTTVHARVRGTWHRVETGHVLPANGMPAIKIACTGALARRGFPETTRPPRDECPECRAGVNRPTRAPGDAASARRGLARKR